ncbi:MAG: polysaccharide biosynthesis/export family protein [Candidatus Eiseniibacteriota bacterium]|jgi:polysaccharide export outer membrane protein
MSRPRSITVPFAIAILLGLAAGLARAQTDYRIEPTDQVSIEVWEKPELTREVSVLADGRVTLPLIGEVRVAGSTTSELEEELARKFSLYDRTITQVSVTVTAYNSKSIYVLGEVEKPGKYASWPIPGIWDLIREAGGPTDSAYLAGVQVIRKGGSGEREILTVDVSQIWGRGLPTDLPELRPDDTINVPKKVVGQTWPDVIYVLGAVVNPGVVQKEGAIDLVGGVLIAGGPSGNADLRKVTIVRRGPGATRTIEVNMENYLLRGDEVSNPLLMPGDTITVGSHRASLFSLNTVRGVATIVTAAVGIAFLIDRINN